MVGMREFGGNQFMEGLGAIFRRFGSIMEVTWNYFIVFAHLTRDGILNTLEGN